MFLTCRVCARVCASCLWFLDDLDAVHVILHRVDDYEDVSELGWDYSPPVVPCVLRPHDVNLVVPQVPQLCERDRANHIKSVMKKNPHNS